jgi:hypothetical protein
MRAAPAILSALLLVVLAPVPGRSQAPAGGPDAEAALADEQVLQKVHLPTDGPALLDYFRKRTFPETNPEHMAVLIRQLGDDEFTTREKAHAEILSLGASALFALRKSTDSPDTEVKRRVQELRKRIEEKANPAVQGAIARLVGKRKPAGAAEVLLAYLPFAADESVVDELCKALGAVAATDGKADPAVVRALEDKSPLKRGAAAEALMRANVLGQLAAVRALLKDQDSRVRLRAALALVSRKEKEAVPALIDALGELPPEQLWQAEGILVRLAGDQTPSVSLGTEERSRHEARKAWQEWWRRNGDKVDLAKLEQSQPLLGYTLIVQQTHRIVNGRFARIAGEVLELDAAKKPRWKFEIENGYPVDAQVLGPDKVLVTEFNGRRLTERDFKGNILWQQQVNGNPLSAQRLHNGNTFVVMQNRLAEIDRAGKEVFAFNRPQHDIFRGLKLRNGEVVFVSNTGILTRLDGKTQREVKSFQVGQVGNLFGSIDVLPNGHVLVPQYGAQRVVEYDGSGRQVWQATVQLPNSVSRLANGHTLVTSLNTRMVVELDRNGREVWSYTSDGQTLFQARRR